MKALTVIQPFATLIVFGPKRVENRGWKPSPLVMPLGTRFAIHSGKKDQDDVSDFVFEEVKKMPPAHWHNGAILGTVVLSRFVKSAEELPENQRPWFIGPIGWVLDEVKPLREPILCSGARGLWDVPKEIGERIVA